jgi:hypothetical protein
MGFMRFTLFVILIALVFGACSSAPKEEPFSVNLRNPRYEVGSTEAYFDRYMSIGNLKKSNVVVYYYPVEDALCLQFKVMFADCNQFWDKTGREAFIGALERYKEDYELRKLTKASKRTARRIYGSTQVFFAWQRTKVGAQAHGSPKIELGYNIKSKAAFFTTTQGESYYVDHIARSRNQTSPVIMMYFTRAQAEELVALFNEEFIQTLRQQRPGLLAPDGSDTDTYLEIK